MALVDLPDSRGYFGDFGGKFVPETLMRALEELEAAYDAALLAGFWLGGFFTYLLVRDLTGEPRAAFVAGLIFATFAGAMLTAWRDADESIRRAVRARRIVEDRFSWSAITDRLTDVYCGNT